MTAEHPNGDAPFAETRTAKWKTPEEPGDYTLECTIDDLPKELEENDIGSRDDAPLKRTLQVKVVKIKFVPAVIRLYKDDTRDVDVLIAPEDVSNLFNFTMLDSGVATHSGAPVTFTITGVAAGTTKFQAKYNDKVFEKATVIVKEHIDDETDDLDDDGILDIFDDDIDGDGIIDNIPAKLWSPDTGISGGVFTASEVTVAANGTASLQVTQASDSDKWRTADDAGYEEDTVHYDWSATGGSVTPDSNEPWKSTFTVPGQAGEYYVKVKIDDEPAAVTLPDRGNRDDSSVIRTIKIIVTQKKWDVDLAIGKYRQEDGNVLENGRLIAPQDQRVKPATPETITVAPGKLVPLEVEAATDIDHWKKGGSSAEEGYDEDEVTYTWSATGGTVTPDPTDPKKATWQAPNDDGDYTVKVTIDDVPKAIPPDEGGTRDDNSIERSVKIKVAPFKIEWEGLARAVAGGVALDGAHDFTIVGTAKRDDDTKVAGAELKLTFEGNKGHDYSGDEEWIKPVGWTSEQIKKAKFVKPGTPVELVEELTVTTDVEGKFSVHVLGSDIISDDIKIKVTWKDENDNEKDVGEKECDFAEAIGRRGFPNQYDPDDNGDDGWLFNQAWLNYPGATTTGKIYLQYDSQKLEPGEHSTWKRVNGHRILFEVGHIKLVDGGQGYPVEDYAIVLNPEHPEISYVIHATRNDGSLDGAATVIVQAEEKINAAELVIIDGTNITQWSD